MSNLARPLDPEFQAVYDQVDNVKAHDAEVVSKNDRQPSGAPKGLPQETSALPEGDTLDGFEAFKALAEKQQKDNAHLPKAQMGSFDHFEQGVASTLRLGWDWLTR